MIFLCALLLVVSSNLDTLQVSLSYGIKKIYLPKSSVLLISILSTLIMFISMYFAELLKPLFGYQLADIFGAMLLCFLGISFIVQYIKSKRKYAGYDTSYFYENPLGYDSIIENPIIIDLDKSNHIDLKEASYLCYAITLNNVCTFFAASLTGITLNLSLLLYFIISIISLSLSSLSYKFSISKWIIERYNLISGSILIGLGILEAFI